MSKNERKLDPRVIRTRQLMRESLMALIADIGYDRITVQHITDRATLNRATFYLHYRDKQDLMAQIINDVLAELANIPAMFASKQMQPDSARTIFEQMFQHVERYAAFYRVMLQEPSVAPYVQQMQAQMEDIGRHWLKLSQVGSSDMLTPPELFISFIGAAYLGMVRWWVLNDMPISAEMLAAQFMRLSIGGIQRDFGLVDVMRQLDDHLRETR